MTLKKKIRESSPKMQNIKAFNKIYCPFMI